VDATAVIIEKPERICLKSVALDARADDDLCVTTAFSGISTGTERLILSGDMPHFPGMGYPLVPGYEAVGRVTAAPKRSDFQQGDWVFVPGAACFGALKGLFGASASRLVVGADRAVKLPDRLAGRPESVLLALAATALHAVRRGGVPDLIIGHGVLGRLAARIALALGHHPTVWEIDASRSDAAGDYAILHPGADRRTDYGAILELSGSVEALDAALMHARRHAQITLGGFYHPNLTFGYPPAFMREVQFVVASEWTPGDMADAVVMVGDGTLNLDGLISHGAAALDAAAAYRTAFTDPACLKMTLDWRGLQ